MFNGFSAIEQLIKMASVHMPKFEQMVNDAETEYYALREAAQQGVQPTLLTARKIEVSCPECNLYFDVTLPESQSG